MERQSPADSADLALKLQRLDREELRSTFRALHLACAAVDLTVDQLLEKPAIEVIEFALERSINVRDLRDICELLIGRLDSLDRDFAAIEKLLSH